MRNAEGTTIIDHATLIRGTGDGAIPDATVMIVDGRISYAGPSDAAPATPPGADYLDATGTTVMPGLIESHWHASYFNILLLEDLDIAHPPETVALHSAFNARLALECGYTSARSAGCLFNTDVALTAAIDSDLLPGPRFVPGGQEICGAGGLMDWKPRVPQDRNGRGHPRGRWSRSGTISRAAARQERCTLAQDVPHRRRRGPIDQ